MPSKALLRPLHAVAAARRVGGAREAVGGKVDVAAVFDRRDTFTHHWDDSSQVQWLEGQHVELVRGQGRLAGPKRVEVSVDGAATVGLRARHAVVVATGSTGAIPPVPGLAEAKPWTTRDATSAHGVPGSLLVVGGGVAGCELAQVFAGLGSRVTLLEVAPGLLAGNEPFAGEMVAAAMKDRGVDVRTSVTVKAVSRGDEGVTVDLDGGQVRGDEVLVAAGRRPRTDDIGLETAGLKPGSWLEVDDSLAVQGVEGGWLYAAGDVNHRALLTHQGKYQARACGDGIVARANGTFDPAPWSKHNATADHRAVPGVIFTDPEVGSVGLTEARAMQAGLNVKSVDFKIGDVAGAALYADEFGGQARLVVDEDRRTIVGATFVGPEVGELVHAATIAVVGEVPLERLWHAVPSYPTISEIWLRLLEAYGL